MILHPGAPPAPHDRLTAWSVDPGVVLPLAATGWLYLRGTRALWQSAAQGRGVRAREVTAFGLGWLTLVVALVSPVHRWGEALFSAHMVQHELLMALAAPLLVLGRPLIPWVWALPGAWRRPVGRLAAAAPFQAGWDGLTHPGVAWTLHGVAIWGWHLPVLFQATLRSETVHAVQHASFLGTGLLFWWTVLQRSIPASWARCSPSPADSGTLSTPPRPPPGDSPPWRISSSPASSCGSRAAWLI
jgi:putative membrane protein